MKAIALLPCGKTLPQIPRIKNQFPDRRGYQKIACLGGQGKIFGKGLLKISGAGLK